MIILLKLEVVYEVRNNVCSFFRAKTEIVKKKWISYSDSTHKNTLIFHILKKFVKSITFYMKFILKVNKTVDLLI